MATKKCVECGATLTGWNSNFFSNKCVDCFRVPYPRAAAFFERTLVTEQDLQDRQISKSYPALIGYALFLFGCIIMGSLVGYGNGGSTQGLVYAFIATLLGIVIFRWRMGLASVHPLDTTRWFNFAFPYTLIMFFSWAIAYMGWMPTMVMGGSIFTFHVRITPTVHIAAYWLAALVGVGGAIVGAIVGYFNLKRQDERSQAHLLTLFKRWQQNKT